MIFICLSLVWKLHAVWWFIHTEIRSSFDIIHNCLTFHELHFIAFFPDSLHYRSAFPSLLCSFHCYHQVSCHHLNRKSHLALSHAKKLPLPVHSLKSSVLNKHSVVLTGILVGIFFFTVYCRMYTHQRFFLLLLVNDPF